MTRVVCFGEILLRLSPPGQEHFFQSPKLQTWFGGAELNVAVSLAHLGLQSAMVSRVPQNLVGDGAIAVAGAHGVDVQHVARGGERLGAYFVESGADVRTMRVVYDRAHSGFSEIVPAELNWPEILHGASWFHLSGITPALGPGPAHSAHDAIQAARALGIGVSLDLNYRAALWVGRNPRSIIRPLAAGSDLLIGNAAAIHAMLDVEIDPALPEPDATRALADRLHTEFGSRYVAITSREAVSASEHGWSAALYVSTERMLHVSTHYQVHVVDRVGGGDAFTAGLIYALLTDQLPAAALAFASAAGAFKLSIPGDFNTASVKDVNQMLTRRGP